MGSDFLSFIRAFGVRWFVLMSGPLSVPLAAAAFYVSGDIAKVGLLITAICCAVFSSYWIWKVEREARNAAENRVVELETEKRQVASNGLASQRLNFVRRALYKIPSHVTPWLRAMLVSGRPSGMPDEVG